MQLILINSSIALVTKDYVPPVNHEILTNQNIIPVDFRPKSNSFSSPVVSQIHYANGFNVIAERNRTLIQFLNTNTTNEGNDLSNLKILKEISINYIKVFNYIKYKAIGINFNFIRDDLDYDSAIKQIVKQGDSSHLVFENNKSEVNNIDLSYKLEGIQLNVSIRKVEKKPLMKIPQSSTQGFVPLFRINAHYPDEYTDNKITIIEELQKNYGRSQKIIGIFQ